MKNQNIDEQYNAHPRNKTNAMKRTNKHKKIMRGTTDLQTNKKLPGPITKTALQTKKTTPPNEQQTKPNRKK